MTGMTEMTTALLTKLVDADLDGIDWKRLNASEQHLAKELDSDLVDIEPRGWQAGTGSAPKGEGQRVLASHSGRIQVLRPIIDDLLQPGVGHVTREEVLAACKARGIQVRTGMLDGLVQCLDVGSDGHPRLRDLLVEARPDPTGYVFRRID